MKRFFKLTAMIMALLLCLGLFAGCDGQAAEDMPEDDFAGDPGIIATAEVSKNEIDMLDVKITVTNTSGKSVTAFRFCAELLDENGNLIEGPVNQIYINFGEDVNVPAGESATFDTMISQRATETIRLYYMYVVYADGSSWGVDKGVRFDTITELSLPITVTVVERAAEETESAAEE